MRALRLTLRGLKIFESRICKCCPFWKQLTITDPAADSGMKFFNTGVFLFFKYYPLTNPSLMPVILLFHNYSRHMPPVTCQSYVHFSESMRLLNCPYITVRKVANDLSLVIFSCWFPLGHSIMRKIQILLNISPLFPYFKKKFLLII